MATDRTTQRTQRIAARIAGWTLLLLMASGFAGMLAFGGNLIVDGDAVATTHNMLAHERAFRAGLACEFVMLNCDIVLALALYALLKPVNEALSLLGSFWRFANAALLGVSVASSLVALDLFSHPHFMSLLSGDQLHPIALIFFDLHDRLSLIGLMFFCLGAGVHSWLLYRARYIPQIISALYLFSCIEMFLCCFAFLVFPEIRPNVDPWFLVPDVVAELSAALWLALKGARLPVNEPERG